MHASRCAARGGISFKTLDLFFLFPPLTVSYRTVLYLQRAINENGYEGRKVVKRMDGLVPEVYRMNGLSE